MTIYRRSKGNYEQHEEVEIFTKKYTVNVGGKASYTCDGQMYYGEPDPFPEMPVNKPIETTNEELVLFFRSEAQAEGFPKRDKNAPIEIEGIKQFKPLPDIKYTQAFGFDFYRPDLYGINTTIYENSIATAQTLEKSFEIDNKLSLEIKNKKGKSKFIDQEFSLVSSKPLGSQNYYIPNVLVAKGKTITIYAKYFALEKEKVDGTITFSDPTGIDTYTQMVTFSKSEEIKPIIITTSPTVNIPANTTLSITIEKDGVNKVIGKCILYPNHEYKANFIFIDVSYNSTAPLTTNYNTLIKDLNEKAFNQAGINIVKSSNQYSLILNPKDCIRIDSGNSLVNSDTVDKSINSLNKITDLDKVLEIACYKFYEKLALELIAEIEIEFKKVKIKDTKGKEISLIKPTENLENLIKNFHVNNEDSLEKREVQKQKAYNKLINNIIGFIEESKANYFIALMCNNLESADDTIAIGHLHTRGLLVSKSGVNDYMTVAHEIGHNFGLGHTFVKPGQINDLQIPMTNTLENIMDYLPGNPAPRKSFMSFQLLKMQKSLDRYSSADNDIDITTTTIVNGTNCLKDSNSNYLKYLNPYLQRFTHQIIVSVFNNIESNNTIILLDGGKDEKTALTVISYVLKKTIEHLQS